MVTSDLTQRDIGRGGAPPGIRITPGQKGFPAPSGTCGDPLEQPRKRVDLRVSGVRIPRPPPYRPRSEAVPFGEPPLSLAGPGPDGHRMVTRCVAMTRRATRRGLLAPACASRGPRAARAPRARWHVVTGTTSSVRARRPSDRPRGSGRRQPGQGPDQAARSPPLGPMTDPHPAHPTPPPGTRQRVRRSVRATCCCS
jgi:hypothetical protein